MSASAPLQRVLVVGVDEDERHAHRRALELDGLLVLEAATGADGLEDARRERPDAVLLDVTLPDIDGVEVARRLRADPRTADAAIVHLSPTADDPGGRAVSLDAGADAYLVAPEDAVLVATVRAVLRSRGAERAADAVAAEWQAAFDALDDAVVLVSMDGVVLRANAAFARLTREGVDPVGHDVTDLVALRDEAGAPAPLRAPPSPATAVLALGDGWRQVRSAAVRDEHGVVVAAVHVLADVTEEQAATLQLRAQRDAAARLATFSQRVSAPLRRAEVLAAIGEHAADVVGGRRAVVGTPEEVATLVAAPGPERWHRVDLRVAGRLLGVLAVDVGEAYAEEGGPDALLTRVAAHAAQALARADAYEAELEQRRRAELSAERTRQLQVVSGALLDLDRVADARRRVLEVVGEVTGARSGALYLRDADGESLDLHAVFGPDARTLPTQVPMDSPVPVVRASTGEVVLMGSREQMAAELPALVPRAEQAGQHSRAALPLVGFPGGAIVLGFEAPVHEEEREEQLAFLLAIARQASSALERARLAEREHVAASLTAALSPASSIDEMRRVVAEQATATLATHVALLAVVDGAELIVGPADGEPARIPLDGDHPFAEALRLHRTLHVTDAALAAELAADMRVAPPGRDAGWVVDPIVRDGRALGALVLGYRGRRWADPVQRDAVGAFAARIISPVERATLFEGERRQRREAEAARARLESLQRVSEAALASVQLDELLPGLVAELRTAFDCDVVAVLLDDRERRRLVVRSATGVEQSTDEPVEVGYGSGLAALLEGTARTTLVEDVAGVELGWPALRDRAGTLLAAPLTAAGELVGGIVVGRESAFTTEDRLLLGLAADRIALAVRHAREHERERDVAITLQRSMLPRGLPSADGVDLAARYVPARERLEVGGDWYDALPLRDGRLALVIGDVAGKGLEAAAVMGQLRNALRAFLIEGRGPADALAHLDALMLHIRLDQMATAAVAIVDPVTGSLVYSLAGHPPPLLAVDGERPRLLEEGRTPPLGVLRDIERTEAAVDPAGPFTLVLYTDGLAERRQQPIDVMLDRLLETLGRETSWAERTCERLLAEALGDTSPEDDVALLALRHGAPGRLRLDFAAAGQELAPARRELRRWLQTTPLDERGRDDVLLAAGEACANAVEHAYDGGIGTVALVAAVDGDAVDLVVTDHGHWREPRPSTRGRGLGIMRRLVDEVDVDTGAEGTRVHLRRALPPARA